MEIVSKDNCYTNKLGEVFNLEDDLIYPLLNFSIFGIGDYSFKPYKIAISGLYKSFHFCLVKPQDGKPVMLDDTCYFIGFNTFEQAEFVWRLLNTELVTNFLKSISFIDSKRMITKEILMRIDLKKIAQLVLETRLIASLHCYPNKKTGADNKSAPVLSFFCISHKVAVNLQPRF